MLLSFNKNKLKKCRKFFFANASGYSKIIFSKQLEIIILDSEMDHLYIIEVVHTESVPTYSKKNYGSIVFNNFKLPFIQI